MTLIERQRKLRRLVQLESVVSRWSTRLARDDGERVVLREYIRTLAELQVGLVREVRRSAARDDDRMLVVDEFAECVRVVSRPPLAPLIERAVARDLIATSQY